MGSYIDNYARPGNPVADITGSTLGINAIYAEKSQSSPTTHPLQSFEALLNLAPATISLLNAPLSQTFDMQWSGTRDPTTNLTVRDAVSQQIVTQIQANSPSAYPAYNIAVNNLPETGILRAIVLDGTGIRAGWTAHNTQIWPLSDATFDLTFDAAVLIHVTIPPWKPGVNFPFDASFQINNANISPSNVTGDIETVLGNVLNFFQGQPPIFQAAEGSIDSAGGYVTFDISPVSGLVKQLASAWNAATVYGFKILTAVIHPQSPYPEQLNLNFEHPQDPAPVPVNAAVPSFPSFARPSINTVQQTQAGSTISVQGVNFPLPQANAMYIGWTDTTSGSVTQSTVRWSRIGFPGMPDATIPRNGASDGQNTFIANNLVPGQQYEFAIQDQDLLTETPFTTPPAIFTTTASDVVELVLSLGQQQWTVGSTTLSGNASFNTPITLPGTLQKGWYRLDAILMGSVLASCSLLIVAAGQPLEPQIRVQGTNSDPSTAQPYPARVQEGYTYTLIFAGFDQGIVKVFENSPSGILLTTATSPGTGLFTTTFVWPGGSPAPSGNLFAQGVNPSQTAEAPYEILPIPQ